MLGSVLSVYAVVFLVDGDLIVCKMSELLQDSGVFNLLLKKQRGEEKRQSAFW